MCSRVLCLVVLGISVSGYMTGLEARPHRVAQIPNGGVHGCATCHMSSDGGDGRNAFGLAIESEFLSSVSDSGDVLWSATLAGRDSDGDGFSNGEELGDPTGSGLVDSTSVVTHPGDEASFPMAAFTGSPMDLDGDGFVDASDFDLFVPRFTGSISTADPDSTIDFDVTGRVAFADLLLLIQNLGNAIADTTLSPASGAGPNVDLLPTLDFQTGNGEIDGVLSGSVEGASTVFGLEVFLGNVQGDLGAVEIVFGLDNNLARVSGFTETTAELVAFTDSSVVLADLDGVDLATNGYLGSVRLTTVSDVTSVPVRVELVSVILVDLSTGLQNTGAAGGIGVTANPLDSVLPDLNGDGLVDEADAVQFQERFSLGAGREDSSFDETIDFDLDEQLTEEDVLLFMLNFGRSQETFTFFRSSQRGPSVNAAVTLDFQAGNFENDGVTSGSISGDGEVFSFDIFVSGVVSELSFVSLTFDVDFSEVSLLDYDPPLGMTRFGVTDSSVVFGIVTGQDVSDGYLGRVDFLPASDLEGIPTPVSIRRALLASAEDILTNEADVAAASVLLNEVVDDIPAADVELVGVEVDSAEVQEDSLTDLVEAGSHLISFFLNAPLLDEVDAFGDPTFAAGLPQFQNFKAYLLPDPFNTGGSVNAAKSVDEESLEVTLDLSEEVVIQAIGAVVPEEGPLQSFDYFVGLGQNGASSVTGTVRFGAGLADLDRVAGPPHVILLTAPPASLIEGLTSEADIVDALSSAWVRGDYLSDGDTFNLLNVPPGDYYLMSRITVLIDGEPMVVTGSFSADGGDASLLSVSEAGISDLSLAIDLPLEPIEVSGVVLAAIEFEGDNMFVETETGDLFEVLASGAGLATLNGDPFEDVTLIAAGDTVRIEGAKLGPDQIRANLIHASVTLAPTGPASDFNGDGNVDFTDFLLFAAGFGGQSSAPSFDSRLDLDASGDVGFSDFLIFASEFGTAAA
jgi:hypothetical protein